MNNKLTNNILAIFTSVLFILLFVPGIAIYLKGVALILLSIIFWIDVDLNSITTVFLSGRGGTERTSNKKIAITTTVFTVIFWLYILIMRT
jgi:hypothetical protein